MSPLDDVVVGAALGTVGTTSVLLTWTGGAPNDAYYTATYRVVCVNRGGLCEDPVRGTAGSVAEGTLLASATSLPAATDLSCYVQTVVDDWVRGCSAVIDASTP